MLGARVNYVTGPPPSLAIVGRRSFRAAQSFLQESGKKDGIIQHFIVLIGLIFNRFSRKPEEEDHDGIRPNGTPRGCFVGFQSSGK